MPPPHQATSGAIFTIRHHGMRPPPTRCSKCKQETGPTAVRCPHCGYRAGGRARAIAMVLVFVAFAALGAFAALRQSAAGRTAFAATLATVRAPFGAGPAVAHAAVARIVDVRAIAGKDAETVARILGRPSRTQSATNRDHEYPAHFYRDGQIEVVFVKGRAEWITISHLQRIPYGPHVLGAFGLPETEPVFISVDVVRWQDVAGVKEISIFPVHGGRSVEYASIFVSTEP